MSAGDLRLFAYRLFRFPYLRKPRQPRINSRRQGADPLSSGDAQRFDVNAVMPMREPPQPPQPRLEQRLRAAHVPAPVMVKRRRYLNDPLQKRFIRFRRSQPNLFPSLMRIKKQPAVELLQACNKSVAMFASGVFGGRTCIARFHSERFRHRSGAGLWLRLLSVQRERRIAAARSASSPLPLFSLLPLFLPLPFVLILAVAFALSSHSERSEESLRVASSRRGPLCVAQQRLARSRLSGSIFHE